MKTQLTTAIKITSYIFALAITILSLSVLTSCQKEESDLSSSTPVSFENGDVAKSAVPPLTHPSEQVVISIEHGSCFGNCAVYNFIVTDKGNVAYNGIQNVNFLGSRQFTVTQGQVKSLQLFMAQQGYFTLRDQYPFVTDLPKTTTFLGYDGNNKTVIDYGVDVPPKLPYMLKIVEDKLGITKLVSGREHGNSSPHEWIAE